MTMHCEMPEPTFAEKNALFELFLVGRREAQQNRPLRTGHNVSTAEQRAYERGYREGMRNGHPIDR